MFTPPPKHVSPPHGILGALTLSDTLVRVYKSSYPPLWHWYLIHLITTRSYKYSQWKWVVPLLLFFPLNSLSICLFPQHSLSLKPAMLCHAIYHPLALRALEGRISQRIRPASLLLMRMRLINFACLLNVSGTVTCCMRRVYDFQNDHNLIYFVIILLGYILSKTP